MLSESSRARDAIGAMALSSTAKRQLLRVDVIYLHERATRCFFFAWYIILFVKCVIPEIFFKPKTISFSLNNKPIIVK